MGADRIMADDSIREKLDSLHERVIDVLTERLDGQEVNEETGKPVPIDKEDLRLALQLLKQNSISAAAMPENPLDQLRKTISGMRISPGHLEARQKALPHLLPYVAPADAAHCPAAADLP
jgi:hypothetical protein